MAIQQQGPAVEPAETSDRPEAPGPRPPTAETVAKWTVGSLLALAIVALSFGAGFGVRMATEGNTPTRASVSSGGAPDFAVLNEIYSALKRNYIDADKLDANRLKESAIDGMIKGVGDAHMGYLSQIAFQSEADGVTGSF